MNFDLQNCCSSSSTIPRRKTEVSLFDWAANVQGSRGRSQVKFVGVWWGGDGYKEKWLLLLQKGISGCKMRCPQEYVMGEGFFWKGRCAFFIEVVNWFSLTFVRSLCMKGLPLEMLWVGCLVSAPSLWEELSWLAGKQVLREHALPVFMLGFWLHWFFFFFFKHTT